MAIGNKLKKMREAAGLSQREVAKQMGWSTPQFCSNFERGISLPSVACISKLAKLYDVDEAQLKNIILYESLEKHEARLRNKLKC